MNDTSKSPLAAFCTCDNSCGGGHWVGCQLVFIAEAAQAVVAEANARKASPSPYMGILDGALKGTVTPI